MKIIPNVTKLVSFLLVWAICFTGIADGISASAAYQPARSESANPPLIPETISASNSVYLRSQKLTANTGAASDHFGASVAISGDYAVVGAPNDDVGSNADQGAAYVYVRSGESWVFQQQLTASAGSANDRFGISVDIDGSNIVVGADQEDVPVNGITYADRGAAYVFSRSGTTWTQVARLINSNDFGAGAEAAAENFGTSVAIDGNKIVVGCPFDDTDTLNSSQRSGSASIFEETGSGWNPVFRAIPVTSGSGQAKFGQSVAVSGTHVVVGATQCVGSTGSGQLNCTTGSAGAAAIYTRNLGSWGYTTVLSNGSSGSFFGNSVGIDGANVVIGAGFIGAAYTSQLGGSGWSSASALPSGGSGQNDFGTSVAIDGDLIVVGNGPSSFFRGNAYVYRYLSNGWTYKAQVFQHDRSTNSPDGFGVATGVDGNRIIIGASEEGIGSNTSQGTAPIYSNVVPRPYDFDGNTQSDLSVFRPSAGDWFYVNPGSSGYTQIHYGASGDDIAPADYDGDGKSDIAVFRQGTWYILNSSTGQTTTVSWGTSGDSPLPNDFDNDGKADVAVFRPSNSTWYIVRSSDQQTQAHQVGQSGDQPIMADYNGDGLGELALYRPGANSSSNSTFIAYDLASAQMIVNTTFGLGGDIPTPGDFDGDGKTDIAIFRPSTNTWWRINSSNGQTNSSAFGSTGDVPVVGDYDRDGESDIAMFRPSTQVWYILNSGYFDPYPTSTQNTIVSFGTSGDTPVPSAYNP